MTILGFLALVWLSAIPAMGADPASERASEEIPTARLIRVTPTKPRRVMLLPFLKKAETPSATITRVTANQPARSAVASWLTQHCTAALEPSCSSDCDECLGNWYLIADALFLHRNRPNHVNISFSDLESSVVLNAHDLAFDYEAGTRITLGRDWGCCRYEVSYFGLQHWTDSARVTSSNQDLNSFFIAGFGPGGFDFDNFDDAFVHRIRYASDIHNVELNLRHQLDEWCGREGSLLLGLRYIKVNEEFNFFAADDNTSSASIGSYTVRADNDLIGLQVGGQWSCPVNCRARLNLQGKGGLFLDFADQTSRIINEGEVVRRAGANDTSLAASVELGMFGSYRLGQHVELRAGYEVLFLSGLSLASEQLDFFAGNGGQSSLSENGSLLLHGPSMGLQITW